MYISTARDTGDCQLLSRCEKLAMWFIETAGPISLQKKLTLLTLTILQLFMLDYSHITLLQELKNALNDMNTSFYSSFIFLLKDSVDFKDPHWEAIFLYHRRKPRLEGRTAQLGRCIKMISIAFYVFIKIFPMICIYSVLPKIQYIFTHVFFFRHFVECL